MLASRFGWVARSFGKAVPRKAKPPQLSETSNILFEQTPLSAVSVRGSPVTIVDSVDSARRIARLLIDLPKEVVVAWNIECTDIDTKRFHTAGGMGGRILCASCTAKGVDFGNGSQGVFIDALPESETEDVEEHSEVFSTFKEYFENSSKLKCSHSIAEDYHVLLEHGIRLQGIESDTRYLARLANTALSSWEGSADELGEGYDLRASVKVFQPDYIMEFEDKKVDKFLKKFNGPKIAHFSSTKRPYWIGRTVENAFYTLDLHANLREQLMGTPWTSEVRPGVEGTMWDLARMVHRPLLQILAELEDTGMGIDKEFLAEIRSKTHSLVEAHTKEFRKACGLMKDPVDPTSYLNCDADMINPGSPQQIRQLLFGSPSDRQSDLFSFKDKGTRQLIPRSVSQQATLSLFPFKE